MMVLTDKDEQVLLDYLKAYKECFEAMNDFMNEVASRIELTDKEKDLAELADRKHKNMLYHIRKWNPTFRKMNKL